MGKKRRKKRQYEGRWQCLFEYWQGNAGTLNWTYVATHIDCDRGYNGNPVCRVCPYQDGS